MPKKPTKPTINRDDIQKNGSQICLNEDDMSALLTYIIELESGYE